MGIINGIKLFFAAKNVFFSKSFGDFEIIEKDKKLLILMNNSIIIETDCENINEMFKIRSFFGKLKLYNNKYDKNNRVKSLIIGNYNCVYEIHKNNINVYSLNINSEDGRNAIWVFISLKTRKFKDWLINTFDPGEVINGRIT